LLEDLGITVNKNAIPNDPQSPFVTSGIRVGSPAITTRGFSEADARQVGQLVGRAIFGRDDETELARVRAEVRSLVDGHPLYPEL
jgi:glycine hydroxymethyltransferase